MPPFSMTQAAAPRRDTHAKCPITFSPGPGHPGNPCGVSLLVPLVRYAIRTLATLWVWSLR